MSCRRTGEADRGRPLFEDEEVTPTLKIRRRAVVERCEDAIEGLYA
jgi:hypothetical protein